MRLNDQNKPYISVFYRNSSQEPSALSIPNCGVACPLDRMFDLHADILPRNWQEECEMIMFDYDGTSTATSIGKCLLFSQFFKKFCDCINNFYNDFVYDFCKSFHQES